MVIIIIHKLQVFKFRGEGSLRSDSELIIVKLFLYLSSFYYSGFLNLLNGIDINMSRLKIEVLMSTFHNESFSLDRLVYSPVIMINGIVYIVHQNRP